MFLLFFAVRPSGQVEPHQVEHQFEHNLENVETLGKKVPNQQRTCNKLSPEMCCRNFVTKHQPSMQIGAQMCKNCVRKAYIFRLSLHFAHRRCWLGKWVDSHSQTFFIPLMMMMQFFFKYFLIFSSPPPLHATPVTYSDWASSVLHSTVGGWVWTKKKQWMGTIWAVGSQQPQELSALGC